MSLLRFSVLCLLLVSFPFMGKAQKKAATEDEFFLLWAVENGNYTNVKLGLQAKTSPNITDKYGVSLLMYAIQKKKKPIIKELIKAGADLNYEIDNKTRPDDNRALGRMLLLQHQSVLDFALNTQDTTIIDIILKAGVPINSKEGIQSPMTRASKNLDYNVLAYLQRQGAKVSKTTARDIVVLTIVQSSDVFNKQSDGLNLIIRFWENYGVEISTENLLKSTFAEYPTSKRLIKSSVTNYEEWAQSIEQPAEQIIRSAAYTQYIDPEYNTKLKEKALKDAIARKNKEWQQEGELERENTTRMITLYLIVGIGTVLFILYKNRASLNRATWNAIFNKLFRVQVQPNRNRNNRNRNNTVNPPKPRTKPQSKRPPRKSAQQKPKPATATRKPSVAAKKGWITDNTVKIHVKLLTIEDMINPIRLCNENEKAVRKMMWYMRRIENHTDEQIAQVLGEEGLLPHLQNLWKSITKTHVRDIYKRSLYLLVEDYSTRDPRVLVFLNTIKKSQPKSNKLKKKPEKTTAKSESATEP